MLTDCPTPPEPSVDSRPRYALIVRLPRLAETQIADSYLWMPGITRPSMGYHITLLGPFVLGLDQDPAVFQAVGDVCARRRPFGVQIAGLGAFDNEGVNTIYLGVVECDLVVPLHDALLQALGERIDFPNERYRRWNMEDYQPHVTLSLGLDERALTELLAINLRRRVVVEVMIESVWLVAQGPASSWQFLQQYPLTGQPEHPAPGTP